MAIIDVNTRNPQITGTELKENEIKIFSIRSIGFDFRN
jgi:hypothetical protein